jgi:hypothetical protein
MGIMISDRSNLALVQVRRQDLADDHGTAVGEFMEKLNDFMEGVTEGNEVVILCYAGTIWADERRDETNAEYDARLAVIRDHNRERQEKSDKSWERQQKKFARAQARKNTPAAGTD